MMKLAKPIFCLIVVLLVLTYFSLAQEAKANTGDIKEFIDKHPDEEKIKEGVEKVDKTQLQQELANLPLDQKTLEQLQQLINLFQDDYQDILQISNPQENIVLIEGSNANALEETALYFVKEGFPWLEGLTKVTDVSVNSEDLLNSNKIIVLLGGPSQNKISEDFFKRGLLQKKEHNAQKAFAVYEGQTQKGSKILVLSDVRGFENIPRKGATKSPLARVMPAKAVIATSSFLSVLLATLWANLSGGIRVWLAKVITGRRKRKINIHYQAKGFAIGNFKIKYREIIAVLIGAVVYTTGVTLALTGLDSSLLEILKLSIPGGLIFFGVREFGRVIFCYFNDLHTEYTLWWPGAVLVLFTGFLGNTLNTPGVVIEHKDKKIKFDKYAFIKYLIVVGTAILGVGLFITNIIAPSKGMQVFAVIATTYATAEILPFKPMPGQDIRKWRPVLFWITLVLIALMYVGFNFVI